MASVVESRVRVSSLKARFENIVAASDDLSVELRKPRPIFQRSKTSLQLPSARGSANAAVVRPTKSVIGCKVNSTTSKIKNVNANNNDVKSNGGSGGAATAPTASTTTTNDSNKFFTRHLDDSKRASIKRSPAFREQRSVGQHKSIHRTSSTPQPMPQLIENKKEKSEIQAKTKEAIRKNDEVNLTDTLKKALSQPLPTGPAPKKPPRAFETAKIEAIHIHNNNAKPQSVRQVASDKISTFVDQNFLGCFNGCASKDPLYDLVPIEPIYMEPFSHLRRGSECSEKHEGSTNGDLHYMCTSISDSFSNGSSQGNSNGNGCGGGGGGNSPNEELSNDEKSLNSFTTYDQINLLVDAAFNEINQLSDEMEAADEAEKAERKRAEIKLSRTLTEKRKDYVRRTVTNREKYRKSVYGTVHGRPSSASPPNTTFQLTDIAVEAGVDASEIVPISERVNKFKELIEANNTPTKKELLSPKSSQNSTESGSLFQCCLLIGFNISVSKPYIKWKYPEKANAPDNIEEMVFPSKNLLYQDKTNQNFSLIFTDLDGNRTYGYCRRILPENSEVFLPLAYCMVTPRLSPEFYFTILTEIETRHGQSDTYITAMLKNLYPLSLPNADQTLICELPELPRPKAIITHPKPKRLSLEANPKWLEESISRKSGSDLMHDLTQISIKRPRDLRLEGSEISLLHRVLGSDLLINIFGTLLLERKIIFYSENINVLSTCIVALQMILYPFYWQYPIIAVLPDHLVDICQAPVPIIIGNLKSISTKIEDGIVVNLDAKQIVQKCGDENTILPEELKKSLLMSLELVDLLDQGKALSNVLISEAFLRFFVELLAALDINSYQRELLIESQQSPSIKLFLEWFTETAMFRHFIASAEQQTVPPTKPGGPIDYSLFILKLKERSNTSNTRTSAQNIEAIMKNCKIITKKSKSTFTEKFKHFFSS